MITAVAASGTTALGMWFRQRVRGAAVAARAAREVTETRTGEWQAILRATNELNRRLEKRLAARERDLASRTEEIERLGRDRAALVTQLQGAERHIERLERELGVLREQVEAMALVTAEYRAAAQGRALVSDLATGPTDARRPVDEQTPVEGLIHE